MVYLFIKIIVCFFAATGMCFMALWFFDIYTSKRSGIHAKLVITHIENTKHAEYALRILEGQISHCILGRYIDVIVADDPDIHPQLIEKLNTEYGNIQKEV